MMKKLIKIRLINWHYFVNETINVNGSFLVSGENTAGKSTILDAISLVLTTNYRKFNTAANEKSKRDLKGYVRCKIGNEGNTYIRKASVITYVALEFYEERTSRYFTLGVKIDSPDEESKLTIKWFREECKIEELSFITQGRPSITEEFRLNGKKVNLISQVSEAKARFGQRLGNLEERFFDIIPKSLAFKPMDNVKDFINRFILAEKTIQVDTLRQNIETLKELEDLMNTTKEKIYDLDIIISKNHEIAAKNREIKINEILIENSKLEAKKIELEEIEKNIQVLNGQLQIKQSQTKSLKSDLDNEINRQTSFQIALGQNETAQIIKDTIHRIDILTMDKENAKQAMDKLDKMLKTVEKALAHLNEHNIHIIPKEKLMSLGSAEKDLKEKLEDVYNLKKDLEYQFNQYNAQKIRQSDILESQKSQKIKLTSEIENLENKKLTYPENTVKLMDKIKKEFRDMGIKSEPKVFSSLLEIVDKKWQNAAEGYLNTQRFYVIVEPKYYDIALEVYNKIKKEVHTVGLVNTGMLDISDNANINSLAYVIKSENRWAKAYATYLLNRVILCENIKDLKNHKVSITPKCMLYQNYAVRKIDERVYQTPYIGESAYEIQLKNKKYELEKIKIDITNSQQNLNKLQTIVDYMNLCKIHVIEENLGAPQKLKDITKLIEKENLELIEAKKDQSYIEIQINIEQCSKNINKIQQEYDNANKDAGSLKTKIDNNTENEKNLKHIIGQMEAKFIALCETDEKVALLGLEKFNEQIKTKSPATIVQNFSPMKVGLETKKSEIISELIKLQLNYCSKNYCDLGSGHEQIQEYINEHHKLSSSDIIKYQEELTKAKENCHLEFRESFLAKLKENIEDAKQEFKNLNAALKDIYYGEDSYKFELTSNKKKESIYQMITSRKNEAGFNLWSQNFDDEYKEEMEELFAKLTAYDDKGEKVLLEYTDYRSYLDYDIIIEKKDKTSQRFSKIYGEKSGGETQTPYYVAIAASFVQLYKVGDTIRIIMFDEAFDKMDDNRISSMMDFLKSQKFQIILATPPSKIEVIGEKVDTVLIAMREGANSIIEEYDL